MQIDWNKTIDEILGDKMTCPRCSAFTTTVSAGYTRQPWGSDYAPRCQFCVRTDACDSRKLVVLCQTCAEELGVRSKVVDQTTLMTMLINDCRKDLEEALDYVAGYWQEDLEVPLADADKSFEEYDSDAFAEENDARKRLEDEYLTYHRWFREHTMRVPDPGWRAEYAEEAIALGYTTALGD
ncbi:MAG: hypothetical protein J4N95_08995 [Chloroflexi bacterium]|nr:hypothetical protein [Chloroflexota bacterium]